jgi:hypothetical protein
VLRCPRFKRSVRIRGLAGCCTRLPLLIRTRYHTWYVSQSIAPRRTLRLHYDYTDRDKQIAYQREQRDATQSETEKAKWQRLTDMLDAPARVAIKKDYAKRAERQAAEAKAL